TIMFPDGKYTEKDKGGIQTGSQRASLHHSPPDSLSNTNRHETHHGRLNHLADLVKTLSSQDAAARYLEEAADDGIPDSHDREEKDGSHVASRVIIPWEEGDKENPHNWTHWGVTAQEQMPLPIATFLMGFVLGPMTWVPLSEQYGRRIVVVSTFSIFTIWTMACALAPSWPAFLVFRFLCGAFASASIAVVTGYIADVYADPVARGRAMAYFMATTVFGPLFAPIISLTECSHRAAALRKRDPEANADVCSAAELEARDLKQLLTVVLTRPLRMILTELIVSSVCAYLALVYAIFYMSFQAFPRIFQDLYGLSPGATGLCFLPIGGGCLLGLPLFSAYDHVLQRAQRRGRAWARQEEYRRVPLACLGGPLFVVSLLWLGWSAKAPGPSGSGGVAFVVPMLAGVPFGLGFMLIFMALINYLTDAYELFAASANAAASACRSLVAVVLPFATAPLFDRLGVAGACSLLAGLSALVLRDTNFTIFIVPAGSQYRKSTSDASEPEYLAVL
ncbi:hypothetical protein PG994_001205, partial [Apiospora phragmitis]